MSATTSEIATTEHPVLFFDGECVMCNGIVDVILGIDRRRVFRYASLQGSTAGRLRETTDFPDGLDTFVLWHDGTYDLRSSAIFEASKLLGFPWSLLSLFSVLPRGVTDAVYRWIARNRIKWFGRRDSCRMPSPHEANLFLE